MKEIKQTDTFRKWESSLKESEQRLLLLRGFLG